MNISGIKPVFSVCGPSGAGKTTWIDALLPELRRRDLSVAVAKICHHDPDIEPDRKDSAKHLAAGARQVLLLAPGKKAVVESRSTLTNEDEIIAFAASAPADIIIIEGALSSRFPKVAVLSTDRPWDIGQPFPLVARVGHPPLTEICRDWSDPGVAAAEIMDHLRNVRARAYSEELAGIGYPEDLEVLESDAGDRATLVGRRK
jgi:molybdopterin-guanine dinucleotide biosynthesis protein MobB